jgi:DNA polymerase-3 subunit gamma/tau
MLSSGAFNALLKTLEEPPAHVKFILATTEIQKVPATIRSRCQCFNFRHIGPDEIAELLAGVAKQEGATADAAVLRRVARLANGSMRDALSILDQLLSVAPKQLTADVLDEMLPPAQNERILALLAHAARGDAAGVLREVDQTLNQGRGLEVFCNDAIEVARALLLLRVCGPETPIADIPAGAREEYVRLSTQFEVSHYVQMIAMLEELKRNVRFSAAGRALVDAVCVRLAHMKQWAAIEQLLEQLPAAAGVGEEKKKAVTGPSASMAQAPVRAPVSRIESLGGGAASTLTPSNGASGGASFSPGPPQADAAAERVHAAQAIPIPTSTREAADVAAPPGAFAVTAEERTRILQDPLVRQAIELFNGVVVQVERRPAPTP